MRIGLFISEFHDKDECNLCIGADMAAKELGVELVIFPGKYIMSDRDITKENPYDYQYTAVFDYCKDAGFDGFIVDINKIGRNAPILKKEKFLNSISGKPLLTVSHFEGYECISAPGGCLHTDLGIRGMEQIILKITGNNVKVTGINVPDYDLDKYTNAINKISCISNAVKNNIKFDDYQTCTKKLIESGIQNFELYLLTEPVECSLKKGWVMPQGSSRVFSISGGKALDEVRGETIYINNTFRFSFIKGTKVIRNFFDDSEQIGYFLIDFNEDLRCGCFDDLLTNLITAWNRTTIIKKKLEDTEDELSDRLEELARDGTVLDHLGEMDYLTDLPSRRGFFAMAYDLLKNEFKEGTYAVVSYIDMDSLKNINAIHGHDEGDHAVLRVAEIIKEVFNEKSVCGRIRGDEFAAIQITREEDKAEELKIEMARQNSKLLLENTKYLNHLIYSICEFRYDENLSLREMLKETDDNLKNMRRMEMIGRQY